MINEEIDRMLQDEANDLYKKISERHKSLSRGIVWCRECGRSQKVNSSECLRSGWPKCCGYTMTIDHPDTMIDENDTDESEEYYYAKLSSDLRNRTESFKDKYNKLREAVNELIDALNDNVLETSWMRQNLAIKKIRSMLSENGDK
jgi:hypothetical protein